jgi:hypothetical protein
MPNDEHQMLVTALVSVLQELGETTIRCETVSMDCVLTGGGDRPRIRVTQRGTGRNWTI